MEKATFSGLNSFKGLGGFPIREETVETPRSELRGGSRKGEGIGMVPIVTVSWKYQLLSTHFKKQDLEHP